MNTETSQNTETIEFDALLEAIDQDYRTATQIARCLGVAPDMNLLDTIDEFCADGKLKRFDLGIHTIFARPGTEATRVIMMDGKAIIPPAGVTYEDAYAQLLQNRTQNPAPVPPPKPNYKAPYPKKFEKKEAVDAAPEPKVDHRKRGRPTGGAPKWGPEAFREFGREGLGLKEIADKLDLQINTDRKHKLRPKNQKAYIEGLAEFDDAQRSAEAAIPPASWSVSVIPKSSLPLEDNDPEPPEPKDQFENNWQEGGIEIPFDESPFNVSKMAPKERTADELSSWSLPKHSLPPEPTKEVGTVTTTETAADPEKKTEVLFENSRVMQGLDTILAYIERQAEDPPNVTTITGEFGMIQIAMKVDFLKTDTRARRLINGLAALIEDYNETDAPTAAVLHFPAGA
jgi:hypothetical protein